MSNPVYKVTCFITRSSKNAHELLLFHHPYSGTQIPAGTVEHGETPEAAAMREAAEESGLAGLVLVRSLGEMDDPPQPGHAIVAQPTLVYSRPNTRSFKWAHFRTGIQVEMLRQENGFTQVCYAESDRYIDSRYVTYNITGWVLDEAITDQRFRHFFLFKSPGETPQQWSVSTENHIFELFWAPLSYLAPIVQPQDRWLKYLMDTDLTDF